MSFDPMSGAPQRPRSTPIPDPDRPGHPLPPPTPAQFLGEQALPWTPKPGPDVNAPFAASAGTSGLNFGGAVIAGGSGSRRLVIVTLIMLVVIGSTVAVLVATRNAAKTVQREISRVAEAFPATTAATVAPVATVTPVTLVPTGAPVVIVPVAPATVVTAPAAETTLPTPPPTTVPAEPPAPVTLFPGGGTSVYDAVSTRAVADQLELAMAGEPTQFTQIILLGDRAVATAQDPAQPSQQIGAFWQDGSIGDATITSSGGGGDITPLLFTEGEVNWEAIAGLVAGAPGQLNMADGQVTSVVVQRSGRGNPIPIVIDVYVEGSGGQRFVEAAADGTVISVN